MKMSTMQHKRYCEIAEMQEKLIEQTPTWN